jgi:hypothetical protein
LPATTGKALLHWSCFISSLAANNCPG